jgi:hypothetical protein
MSPSGRKVRGGTALAKSPDVEETMDTKRIRMALLALPMLFLGACGQASNQTRANEPLVAMATPHTDSPAAYRAALAPAPPVARIPDAILHDPAERFALMERLRTEIVNGTRQVPEQRWYNEVRPALRVQLADAGLARKDVDFLLLEIDQAKK